MDLNILKCIIVEIINLKCTYKKKNIKTPNFTIVAQVDIMPNELKMVKMSFLPLSIEPIEY